MKKPIIYHYYMKLPRRIGDIIILNALVTPDGDYLLSQEGINSNFGIHYNDIKLFEEILEGTLSADIINVKSGKISTYSLSPTESIKEKLINSNNILTTSFGIQSYYEEINISNLADIFIQSEEEEVIPPIVILGKTITFQLKKNTHGLDLTIFPFNCSNTDTHLISYLNSYSNILKSFFNFIVSITENKNNSSLNSHVYSDNKDINHFKNLFRIHLSMD